VAGIHAETVLPNHDGCYNFDWLVAWQIRDDLEGGDRANGSSVDGVSSYLDNMLQKQY
jgi:hypothetical protein